MTIKPFRIHLSTAGEKLDIDFRAHETDDKLVVVKTTNPEAVDELITLTGVDPEVQQTINGSHYVITMMTKAGAARFLAALVTLLVTKDEAYKLASTEADDGDDGDGGDEGQGSLTH